MPVHKASLKSAQQVAEQERKREADRNAMLKPSISLLVKLGSIVVHIDEMLSSDGHMYDEIALKGLIADPEISAWRKLMDSAAFIPKKRQQQEGER